MPESRLPFALISFTTKKLELVSETALKKWNTNFRLEHSDRESGTTFVDVALLLEFFRRNDPKSHVLFTFQPDYPETFCKW